GSKNNPGRSSILSRPFRIISCNRFGNPPYGCPIYPWKNSMTEAGKSIYSPRSYISSSVKLFCTINKAISPIILEEGVTLTTSPNISFTVRYITFTSSHRPSKPTALPVVEDYYIVLQAFHESILQHEVTSFHFRNLHSSNGHLPNT